MTTYLADTNILINALKGKRGHREVLYRLVSEGNRIGCCTVVLAELFSGIRPEDMDPVEQFVSMLRWYPASIAIGRRAGQMRFEYARKGIVLGLAETLIAATALEHGLTLITGNRKHFPMPGLLVEALEG